MKGKLGEAECGGRRPGKGNREELKRIHPPRAKVSGCCYRLRMICYSSSAMRASFLYLPPLMTHHHST
jgi:hypothetical protein